MKLLILDIDETLIHASEKPLNEKWNFNAANYYVYLRPHLKSFLDYCEENFNVAVWTTAGSGFAKLIVDKIFKNDYPLKFVWSVEMCTRVFEPELQTFSYIKNLKKVKRKGYKLEDVIMIDNTPSKLRKNYGNLVKIDDFLGQKDDSELLRLIKYLEDLKNAENIRALEKRGWKKKYQL